jgi:tripeptide aminopeptidase
MKETALERFLRYAKIDTQSDPNSETAPTTMKQFDLANLLVKELLEMGIADAAVDDKCYVYATLPSNLPAGVTCPKIGFIAHVDTSPDTSGANVKPNIIEKYMGGDIVLPGDPSRIIKDDPIENPALKRCIGHKIVTSDGTTLLGADDKGGVAAIMTMVDYYLSNPEIIHGDIGIAFTPDEEVGRGADHFDVAKFGCVYAYTVDGEMPGEINKETFSANSATIKFFGRDIHPGFGKDIMVNSIRAMADVIALMPKDMAPETTNERQPYIHPHKVDGTIAESRIDILLRDFDTDGLTLQKQMLEEIIAKVEPNYPKTKITLEITESYRNMHDKLMENPIGLDYLWQAAEQAGANPFWAPIRGGTDGSRLTFMGLPCPNIYAGGQNFHSNTEWISIDALELSLKTLINLVEIWTKSK